MKEGNTMIDRIIGYMTDDEGWEDRTQPIYSSDLYPYSNYIGYEDGQGQVHLYEEERR